MSDSQALVKFEVRRTPKELASSTDVVIRDATTGEPVVWEPISVEAPEWLAKTVKGLETGFEQFRELAELCQQNKHELRTVFPKLAEQYDALWLD